MPESVRRPKPQGEASDYFACFADEADTVEVVTRAVARSPRRRTAALVASSAVMATVLIATTASQLGTQAEPTDANVPVRTLDLPPLAARSLAAGSAVPPLPGLTAGLPVPTAADRPGTENPIGTTFERSRRTAVAVDPTPAPEPAPTPASEPILARVPTDTVPAVPDTLPTAGEMVPAAFAPVHDLPALPVSALPSVPLAAASSGSAADARAHDEAAVRTILGRYVDAYQHLNVRAAALVWPSVDQRALARAFGSLKSQALTFAACDVSVAESTATARCLGSLEFTTRIGNATSRIERQQWLFRMRRQGAEWRIEDVSASRTTTSPS